MSKANCIDSEPHVSSIAPRPLTQFLEKQKTLRQLVCPESPFRCLPVNRTGKCGGFSQCSMAGGRRQEDPSRCIGGGQPPDVLTTHVNRAWALPA